MPSQKFFGKGKNRNKGAVVLSETLLAATEVIISFILIVLIIQLVFQQQSSLTVQSAYDSVARDISTSIDRADAAAGSIAIEQPIPKGVSMNVTIDYKTVIVSYGGNSVKKSFVALTYSNPVSFVNPTDLCVVKTANDGRIHVESGNCTCDPKSNTCDAACVAKGICQQACLRGIKDDVCNPYCLSQDMSKGICDKACYQNFTTGVFNPYCYNANNNPDGICSPDSNNIVKGICSKTCYYTYSNGNTGICDPDCPSQLPNLIKIGNLTVKPADGHCYTGCINTSIPVQAPVSLNPSPLTRPCNANMTSQENNIDFQCSDDILWNCGTDILGCNGHGPSVRCSEPCIRFPGANSCCDYTNSINTSVLNGTDTVCCCQYNGGTCATNSRSTCLQQGSYAFPADSQYCQQSPSSSSGQGPTNSGSSIPPVANPSPLKGACPPWSPTAKRNFDLQCLNYDEWQCGTEVRACILPNGTSSSCSSPCVENPEFNQQNIANGYYASNFSSCCNHYLRSSTGNLASDTDPVCCCQYNGGTCLPGTRGNCVESGSYAFPADSQYCKQPVSNPNKITLISDGVCDQDCNATSNICDPDCPNSPACQNQCASDGQAANGVPCCPGLIKCAGNNVCTKFTGPESCCGNGICEGPGMWPAANKTQWETPYTCPADCPGSSTRLQCPSHGSFVSSVCYSDIDNQAGSRIGDKPTWSGSAISVCDPQAGLYLDRRSWDINQVFASMTLPAPGGFAFDASRYVNACQRVQPAGMTISANENYTSSSSTCCSLDGTGCPFPDAPYLGQQCAGVGYCADHAAAVLSILRTLGIPPQDVFITFEIQGANCGRHAFVAMKCDPSLKNNPKLWPTACNGLEGQWLAIDATNHFVTALSKVSCVTLGMFWNDMGIYPLTYGNATYFPSLALPPTAPAGTPPNGYTTPPDAICNTYSEPTPQQCISQFSVSNHYQDLCQPFNVNCIVPPGLPNSP